MSNPYPFSLEEKQKWHKKRFGLLPNKQLGDASKLPKMDWPNNLSIIICHVSSIYLNIECVTSNVRQRG